MSRIIVSLSNNSYGRGIDEYHNESSLVVVVIVVAIVIVMGGTPQTSNTCLGLLEFP